MLSRSWLRTVTLLVLALPLGGCLFHTRRPSVLMSNAPLKTATFQQLMNIIDSDAAQIRTLNATVDIAASTGGSKKGKITEYQEIKGYILARKPDMLRMIGLFPIVRNRAFDMVSDGKIFKLWLPTKNRFIVGHNNVVNPDAKQPLENLRPQYIYDALLMPAIDPKTEVAVLEQGNQTITNPKNKKQLLQPDYVIDIIERDNGTWHLARKIFFNRVNLQPYRQLIYDKNGSVATDATYENFREFNGIWFPDIIHIFRPQEEYAVTITIEKLRANEPLKDEQFALAQPSGSQLVNLGNSTTQTQAHAGPGN